MYLKSVMMGYRAWSVKVCEDHRLYKTYDETQVPQPFSCVIMQALKQLKSKNWSLFIYIINWQEIR